MNERYDVPIPTLDSNNLSFIQLIGNGGMGKIELFKCRRDGDGLHKDDLVAVKSLGNASNNINGLRDEARILWRLQHECEHILHLYGVLDNHSGNFCLLLEYMKHGNVGNFFAAVMQTGAVQNGILWPLKIRIVSQVCEGMEFLHGYKPRPILHRDLKAANVLLDGNLNAKICDFGLAKIRTMTTKSSPVTFTGHKGGSPAGTVSHIAPELLSVNVRATKKSDVYSFGILLWELMTNKSPYEESNVAVIINDVLHNGKRPDMALIPRTVECESLAKLMKRSWEQEPTDRPEFSELSQELLNSIKSPEEVEQAVIAAKEAWTDRNNTPAKVLNDEWGETNRFTTRDDNGTDCHSAPGETTSHVRRRACNLHTQSFPFPSRPQAQPDLNHAQPHPNIDVSAGNICISSSDENSTDSGDSSVVHRDPKTPLLGSAYHSARGAERSSAEVDAIRPKLVCKRWIITVAISFAVLAAGGAIGYFIPHRSDQHSKSCCLRCFDWSDPGLQSDCSPTLKGNQSALPGSKCTFSCTDGYILNGNHSVLTCDTDAKWSGPLPYCRKVRQCETLPSPANSGSLKCTNKNYESSVCQFLCPDGYRIRLPGNDHESPTSYEVSCDSDVYLNYHWSGPEPYCEKVIECPPPPVGEGVTVACSNPDDPKHFRLQSTIVIHNGQKIQVADSPKQYTNGTACQFSCADGTKSLSNDSAGICQENGKWNFTEADCISGCAAFSEPVKGNVSCTLGRKYDSKCTFACNENFVMLGGTNPMVCLKNGKWNRKPPSCVCPACRSGDECSNSVNFNTTVAKMNETRSGSFPYDGHMLTCYPPNRTRRKPSADVDDLGGEYECQCRDKKTNNNKQCNKYSTQFEACRYALASLILIMASNGTYTLPCDADEMPPSC